MQILQICGHSLRLGGKLLMMDDNDGIMAYGCWMKDEG